MCSFPYREEGCVSGLIFHQLCLGVGAFLSIDAGIPSLSLSVNGAPYLALSLAAATITTNNLCFTSRSRIDSFSRLGRTLWYANAERGPGFSRDHINVVLSDCGFGGMNIHITFFKRKSLKKRGSYLGGVVCVLITLLSLFQFSSNSSLAHQADLSSARPRRYTPCTRLSLFLSRHWRAFWSYKHCC